MAIPWVVVLFISLVACSPEDPHVPKCSSRLKFPFIRKPSVESDACLWFEGWYVRILDPSANRSFAVIAATLNSTGESMAAILACYNDEKDPYSSPSLSLEDIQKKAWMSADGTPCRTLRVVDVLSKGSVLTTHGHPVDKDPDLKSAPNFEWTLPGYGSISVNSESTVVDLTVESVSLKAKLTNQKWWNSHDPGASPEGWVGKVFPFFLPARWYVYSVGSKAEYNFKNGSMALSGLGWGHEEKNWGNMFPEGHVWAQAISPDNSVQVVLAIVYFKILGSFTSPYVVTIGYRSPAVEQDFLTVGLGSFMTHVKVDSCNGSMMVIAHTISHTVRVEISAPIASFGPKLWAPTKNGVWERTCMESFSAVAKVGLWVRNDTWAKRFGDLLQNGTFGSSYLVDRLDIHSAALEFGGALACDDGGNPSVSIDGLLLGEGSENVLLGDEGVKSSNEKEAKDEL